MLDAARGFILLCCAALYLRFYLDLRGRSHASPLLISNISAFISRKHRSLFSNNFKEAFYILCLFTLKFNVQYLKVYGLDQFEGLVTKSNKKKSQSIPFWTIFHFPFSFENGKFTANEIQSYFFLFYTHFKRKSENVTSMRKVI